jgi:hypothetical protein
MWRTPGIWLAAVWLCACSGSNSNDFFENPEDDTSETTSGSSSVTSSTVGTTTAGGMAQTDEDSSTLTGSGGGGATSGDAAPSTGGDSATSSADETGGGTTVETSAGEPEAPEVVTVDVELESGTDCVEVACPADAPHAVACDITFSQTGPLGVACVAQEMDGSLYIQSGTSCHGTEIASGTISCSSQPPDEALFAGNCVSGNKPNLQVVGQRCQCEGDVPGCGFDFD